jgi:hypothetical protein
MALEIKEVDVFPKSTRSGRISEELQQIINSLTESSKSGKTFVISNVEQGKKFNSLQQRIRTQAKKMDIKVMIHFDKSTGELYYKCPSQEKAMTSVTAKEVKSVKTATKTKA